MWYTRAPIRPTFSDSNVKSSLAVKDEPAICREVDEAAADDFAGGEAETPLVSFGLPGWGLARGERG